MKKQYTNNQAAISQWKKSAPTKPKNTFSSNSGPVLFFDATGDFETIIELIKENGGEVTHAKTLIVTKENNSSYTIPNTYIDNKPGYYAHFTDSEGNRMGLYGTN